MQKQNSLQVSVILPTHNRADLLPRSIGSVLAQTFTEFELLVVDDGSDEDLQPVVNSFSDERIRLIRRPECGGPGAARNTGLDHAVGEYVAFQDSDDEWLPDKLQRQMYFLSRNPGVALVSCGLSRQDSNHRFVFPARAQLDTDFLSGLQKHLITFTQTWLAERQALTAAGGFDPALRIWDDWDLLFRVAQREHCEYMPDILVISHVTVGSVGSDITRRINDLEVFTSKYQGKVGRKQMARFYYLLGRFRLTKGERGLSRVSLARALMHWPLSHKSWLMMMLTLFPGRVLSRILKNIGRSQ